MGGIIGAKPHPSSANPNAMNEAEHAKEATKSRDLVVCGGEVAECFDSKAGRLLTGVQVSRNASITRFSSEESP